MISSRLASAPAFIMIIFVFCHMALALSPEVTAGKSQLPITPEASCTIAKTLTFLQSLAWPLLVLIVVLLVAFNARVGRLFGLLPKFVHKIRGPAGIEIEVNADAAKEVRANFRSSYQEFVRQAKDEYERMADARSVPELLRNVVISALPEMMQSNGLEYDQDSVRATVHVEDIVFRDYLYQLTNYFPAGQSGGGAGRRFSQRYGIIGQSWRLNESIGRGTAVSGIGPPPTRSDKERAIKELVARWGMTEDEATAASHERPATLSVILRYDGQRHGVLYIDSKHMNAFGADEEHNGIRRSMTNSTNANTIARALERHSAAVRLARAVAEALDPLRLAAPYLEVGR